MRQRQSSPSPPSNPQVMSVVGRPSANVVRSDAPTWNLLAELETDMSNLELAVRAWKLEV